MASEEERIIAFIFKREGKEEISLSAFCLSLSIDLNWCSPKQAKEFIERAVIKKLLVRHDDVVSPTFDVASVIIPVDFQPSIHNIQIEEKKRTVHEKESEFSLQLMIQKIAKESAIEEEDITKKLQDIAEGKNISSEVAALFLGKELGLSLPEFFDPVNESIFKQNKE